MTDENTARFEVIVKNKDGEQKDNLPLLCLEKSRRLGFTSSADFFQTAYAAYNPDLSDMYLSAKASKAICSYIIKTYEINVRDDLYYLMRHPKTDDIDLLPAISKKVLIFTLDSDEARNAAKALEEIVPRARAAFIEKVIGQYMTVTENNYFVKQSAERMVEYISKLPPKGSESKVTKEMEDAANLIWDMGRL